MKTIRSRLTDATLSVVPDNEGHIGLTIRGAEGHVRAMIVVDPQGLIDAVRKETGLEKEKGVRDDPPALTVTAAGAPTLIYAYTEWPWGGDVAYMAVDRSDFESLSSRDRAILKALVSDVLERLER